MNIAAGGAFFLASFGRLLKNTLFVLPCGAGGFGTVLSLYAILSSTTVVDRFLIELELARALFSYRPVCVSRSRSIFLFFCVLPLSVALGHARCGARRGDSARSSPPESPDRASPEHPASTDTKRAKRDQDIIRSTS